MRGGAPTFMGLACAVMLSGLAAQGARAQSIQDLRQLSISQLENISVSSVTKTRQALKSAPGAIYVITHDEIMRSGATTIAQMLRLAPNLQVAQISASKYVITARGFSGNLADQNFSNKLLVLIDGRSVYSPLFSGVYWDMQDVPAADIERIEVISGPGAALWGANAVNGVINIITRKASQTQGGLLDITAGNLEQSIGLRYGGTIRDDLAYRLYVRDYSGDDTQTAKGANAHDHWSKPQGGFRLDWTPSDSNTLMLEGNAYAGSEAQLAAPNEDIEGRNLLARWNHAFADGSSLQVQAYYDGSGRATEENNGNFWIDTYDLDIQHHFRLGGWNDIVWGGGYRASDYWIHGTASLYFVPARGTIDLADVFAQDSIALGRSLTAILGVKLESDPYSGLNTLPSARLSWKPNGKTLLWAAVSRAIRSPTPFDTDVAEDLGGVHYLAGNADFQPVTLTAYEMGARVQPLTRLSFSVSAFYNFYDDLRTIEWGAPPSYLPLTWGNRLKGRTYGIEAWGSYDMTSWWRLTGAVDALTEHFDFKPAASGLLGTSQIGDDPAETASLRSSVNISPAVNFDADLRYVGALPAPRVPAYVELNASIGWNVSRHLRLALSGFNLLHARHQEFPAPQANAVLRSFSAGLQWRF